MNTIEEFADEMERGARWWPRPKVCLKPRRVSAAELARLAATITSWGSA